MAGAWGVGADDLEDVATALRFEEDGTRLRRALSKELRQAVDPAVAEAKGRIMAMDTAGLPHGQSLRGAIARQVKAQTRLTGKSAGVRVRVSRKGMPRGFDNAPKRTNRDAGWRHPVPVRYPDGGATQESDTWVHQVGAPGWFDNPMQEHADDYLAAVQQVIADTADRISKGAR